MREIKFRAWDERAELMHEDFRYIKSGDEGNDWIIFTSNRQTLQEKHHPFENPYFQEQFKIMQYTGLKDANGIEIYESDIVQTEIDFGYGPQKVVAKVIWKDAGWQFNSEAGCAYGSSGSFTVIGNIY